MTFATRICVPCDNAATLGYWGPNHRGTHHPACHRSWSGGAHCLACCRHFSSGSGFDLHQKDGTCRDITALLYACGAPRFVVVGSPGQEVITGTLHEKVCKNWTACGFRGTR